MGFLDKLFKKNQPPVGHAYSPSGSEPAPDYDTDADAELVIADLFDVGGRGVVVVGLVNGGAFKRGDKVIIRTSGGDIESAITGIEVDRRQCDIAPPDTGVGLLLRGVKRGQINVDDVVRKRTSKTTPRSVGVVDAPK